MLKFRRGAKSDATSLRALHKLCVLVGVWLG